MSDPTLPVAQRMIADLDLYFSSLYPAESDHGMSIAALLQPSVRFFLAWVEDAAIGCGAYKVLSSTVAELKRMYVDPEHRGNGYGRRLLLLLEDAARSEGIDVMRLETGIFQPEAVALYGHSGYREIPPFAPYQPDPVSLFFEKRLA